MKIEAIAGDLAEFYGYSQIMTYAFDDPATFDRLRLPQDSPLRQAIRLQNPLCQEMSILRTTSVGHMLSTLALNVERKHRRVSLYEMANVYISKNPLTSELPDERMQFTVGAYGRGDFFSMKGIAEELLRRVGMRETVQYDPKAGRPFLHPGRQANMVYGGEVIGFLGEVHPLVAESYGIPERVMIAVIDMPKIVERADFTQKFTGLNRHERISRDVNLLVLEDVPAGDVEMWIRSTAGDPLERLELVDVYRGPQVPEGFKAMTWHLRFQGDRYDITAEEVNRIIGRFRRDLEFRGIVLRPQKIKK